MSPLQRHGAHSVFSEVRFPQYPPGHWHCHIYSFIVSIQSQNISNVQVWLGLSVSPHPSVSSNVGLVCHTLCWVLDSLQGVWHTKGTQSTFGDARALTALLCHHTNCAPFWIPASPTELITLPLNMCFYPVRKRFALPILRAHLQSCTLPAPSARRLRDPLSCGSPPILGPAYPRRSLIICYHVQLECVRMARSLLRKARDGCTYLPIHSI